MILCGLMAALLSGGCAVPTMPNIVMNPETRNATFTVDMPFDAAFTRAVQTFGALGGSVTSQDARAGTVAATVHNAVNMTVSLNRVSDTRTELVVYGSTIPGEVVVGVFTEVEDYQKLYMSGTK